MPKKREQPGFDLDMLTDYEKRKHGFPEEYMRGLTGEHFETEPKQKCCFCNRKMKSPVTKFERYGVNFIPEDKKAHEGCARRRFEKIKDVMKSTMGD